MIHWTKRPLVLVALVALAAVVAALGGGIHWDSAVFRAF